MNLLSRNYSPEWWFPNTPCVHYREAGKCAAKPRRFLGLLAGKCERWKVPGVSCELERHEDDFSRASEEVSRKVAKLKETLERSVTVRELTKEAENRKKYFEVRMWE
jgi:hypothetical protein